MSRFNCLVGLAIVIFAAGCAATPEVATQNAGGAPVGTSAPGSGEEPINDAAPPLAVEPLVVDLTQMPSNEVPSRICRQMLKPLSNVIVTYCLTPAEWDTYKQQEAIQAQQMLRMMQGSAFR